MSTKTGLTVRNTQVQLQRYRDPATNKDLVAVFHNDYRHVWLQMLPSTQYAHTRARGPEEHDQTCYYAPHHNASGERTNWPAVLFTYLPKAGLRASRKPEPLVTPEGWLVIDINSKPVLNFRAPLTLSSKAASGESGWLLEAIMRENYDFGMQVQDLRARMPGVLDRKGKDSIRNATMSMVMHRFRLSAGCISWSFKNGGDAFKDYLDVLLPKSCLDANSTVGFRNLHKHEVQEMVLLNVGTAPGKARAANKGNSNGQKLWDEAVKRYQKIRRAYDGTTDFTDTYKRVQAIRGARNRRNSDATTERNPDSDEPDAYDSDDSDGEYRDIPPIPTRFGTDGFPIQQTTAPTVPPFDVDGTRFLLNQYLGGQNVAFGSQQPPVGSLSFEDIIQQYPELLDVDFNTQLGSLAPQELPSASPLFIDMTDVEQPPSNSQAVVEFLNLQPVSAAQMDLIETFLEPTRTQFTYVTEGEIPPATDERKSYLEQWKEIDQAMIDWLKVNGVEGEEFTLLRLEEFSDANISWNGPWYSQIFGEEIDTQLVEYLIEMAKLDIGK